MQNIEDLVKQIVVSPIFKNQMHKQLRQYMLEQENSQVCQNTVTLPQLIGEINGYISEITQIALEEENSKNYIMFMKKNQDLCFELERQINARMQSITEQLRCKIDKINSNMIDLEKSFKKNYTDGSRLKQERKIITKNLLETSKLQNSAKTQSTINMKSFIKSAKSNPSSYDVFDENETSSSLEASKSKFESIVQLKQMLQIWENKMENAIQTLKKDQGNFAVSTSDLCKSLEAKLQGNLQSIWNVISDLCSRISKFQTLDTFDTQP